jgi:uncharacterized integral membrane protein
MWRLIGIVIVLLLYLVFILLNQDSRGSVSLGFLAFHNVHTYMITFFAFTAGIVTASFFSIVSYFRKRTKTKSKVKYGKKSGIPAAAEPIVEKISDIDEKD